MIEVTDAMINAVRAHVPAPCSREQARRAAEALLNMPEVREAFEAELGVEKITEEPQGIGTKVIDSDGDIWILGFRGWSCEEESISDVEWRLIRRHGPFRRIR